MVLWFANHCRPVPGFAAESGAGRRRDRDSIYQQNRLGASRSACVRHCRLPYRLQVSRIQRIHRVNFWGTVEGRLRDGHRATPCPDDLRSQPGTAHSHLWKAEDRASDQQRQPDSHCKQPARCRPPIWDSQSRIDSSSLISLEADGLRKHLNGANDNERRSQTHDHVRRVHVFHYGIAMSTLTVRPNDRS
jgi:hypothetical protein